MKELHESVPVDANGAERLKELLQLSLQQAMREAASTVSDPLSETEVKECGKQWRAAVPPLLFPLSRRGCLVPRAPLPIGVE